MNLDKDLEKEDKKDVSNEVKTGEGEKSTDEEDTKKEETSEGEKDEKSTDEEDKKKEETSEGEKDENSKDEEDKKKEEISEGYIENANKEEIINQEEQKNEEESYQVESMLGYVNNLEIGDENYPQETEEERNERLAMIGQSLTITKLEDAIDEVLKRRLRVKNTEERIRCLREVLRLLEEEEKVDVDKNEILVDSKNVEEPVVAKKENEKPEPEPEKKHLDVHYDHEAENDIDTYKKDICDEIKKLEIISKNKTKLKNMKLKMKLNWIHRIQKRDVKNLKWKLAWKTLQNLKRKNLKSKITLAMKTMKIKKKTNTRK